MNSLDELLVFFFGFFLVEDAIFLIAQSCTADAIFASLEIEAISQFTRAMAILAIQATMQFSTVHTFIAILTLTDDQGIYAVS